MEKYKTISTSELYSLVEGADGFSEISAKKIVSNIKHADIFIDKLSKFAIFKTNITLSSLLVDKKFVFSGFRNTDTENLIKKHGGTITTSISKSTSGVIVNVENYNVTGKIKRAIELDIPIYIHDEFVSQFN